MSRRNGSWVKKQRLLEISKQIAASMPRGISYERMLTWIQFNIGLTKKKAREYLALVIHNHEWEIKDDFIKPMEILE